MPQAMWLLGPQGPVDIPANASPGGSRGERERERERERETDRQTDRQTHSLSLYIYISLMERTGKFTLQVQVMSEPAGEKERAFFDLLGLY